MAEPIARLAWIVAVEPTRPVDQTRDRSLEELRLLARLPVSFTSILAREQELSDVSTLLRRDDVRLLTLTGPGGVGKTRLALAIAHEAAAAFGDGVAFVGLATVRDKAFVGTAIAHALGMVEAADNAILARISAGIGAAELLLVLDNFEHILDAAPLVSALLAACPGLTVLTTSRAALHVSGEQQYPVLPLPVTTAKVTTSRQVADVPAVRLFVERARAVEPRFVLTDDNAAAIAAICTRLDGLPLAIELAAARSKVLPPSLLLPKLARQLPLLTGGPRDVPSRLQTMAEAVAWSYNLLSAAEQQLFCRLAVFVGGFTLAAAEAIVGDPHTDALDLLTLLSALVDQSLIGRDETTGQAPRFSMLEPIREFAVDRLSASTEAPMLRARHAAYYLALATDAEVQIIGQHQVAWLRALQDELPNFRVALAWLRDEHRIDDGLDLVGRLSQFWYRANHFSEGRRHLAAFLDLPTSSARTAARARALVAAAELANWQMDLVAAEAAGEAALLLWQSLGDTRGVGRALNVLGSIAIDQDDVVRARELLASAATHHRESNDAWGAVWTSELLGVTSYAEGDYAQAAARFADGLAQARALGDVALQGEILGDIAHVALVSGDLVSAAQAYVETLAIYERFVGEAQVSNLWGIAWCIAGLGAIAAQTDLPLVAARLQGARRAMDAQLGAPMRPSVNQHFDTIFAHARVTVGEPAWDAMVAEGAKLSVEEAIHLARSVAARLLASVDSASSVGEAQSPAHGLTPREMEVLRLVAAGHANAEIAAMLFISVPTVKRHLSTILGKLDLPSRPAAVAFAHTHDLA